MKEHLKSAGVFLSSAIVVGVMSALSGRRKTSLSKTEADEWDPNDRGENEVFKMLDRYNDMASEIAMANETLSEDVDLIVNESMLDFAHEGVKHALRQRNPLMASNPLLKSFSYAHGQDTYEGMPKGDIEKWSDPNVRFLVFFTSALQARAAHDRIKRMAPMATVFGDAIDPGTKEDDAVFFTHPHPATLQALANAQLMAAGGANIERAKPGATRPTWDHSEAVLNMLDRLNLLIPRYMEQEAQIKRSEKSLETERKAMRRAAREAKKLGRKKP